MRILNDRQEVLLKDARNLLNDLRAALIQFGASTEDHNTLAQSIRQMDELFLLVVVGEFNAGKSAFINALLGQKILKEGVTPTTTQINVLRYGETQARTVENENLHSLTAPVEMLRELSIVDTPGTNAIMREHEAITAQFVPRSDLVLFVTSADRPFTESERVFLEKIRDWGKKVVIVLNKIDLFQEASELEQVRKFMTENAQALFGLTPEFFPVSARLALRAKQGEPELWETSRFGALENYIRQTLDESSRLRLKFLNPLGVASHLVGKYLDVTVERLSLLRADFDMLADVDAQLAQYKEDMQRNFKFRMADIENVLYEMEKRGLVYFDEMLRLGRVFDLLDKERIQIEFEKQVVADTPQRIETRVNELIDWLVEADLRQWQAVNEHIAERRRAHQDRIVGDAGGSSFHFTREHLIEGVGREAQRVVEMYDKEREAEAIAEGARTVVAALAAVEIGAVSLGTIITILATTAAADVTGIVLASVVAVLGLFLIPARRRQAKSEMLEKIATLRERLVTSLSMHFEQEMGRSLNHIQEAIAPYTRFVRAEKAKLQEIQGGLEQARNNVERIKGQVEDLI
jgi:small GTP-binding protein